MTDSAAAFAALDRAHGFVAARVATAEQRALLDLALDAWAASPDQPLGIALFPSLVYEAAGASDAAAEPLSTLAVLLIAGLDLLDAIMDDELEPCWQPFGPGRAMLAGLTLALTLPQALLAELPISAALARRLQRTLARSALVAAAGQDSDLRLHGDACTVAEVEAVAARKSGEPLALLASLAAQLAGAAATIEQHYAAMARAMGVAAQFCADCRDVLIAAHSRDFASGARTLPIALRLALTPAGERQQFLALLDRARSEAPARHDARHALTMPDVLAGCGRLIELYRYRALRELAAAHPRDPPAARLRAYLGDVSMTARVPSVT